MSKELIESFQLATRDNSKVLDSLNIDKDLFRQSALNVVLRDPNMEKYKKDDLVRALVKSAQCGILINGVDATIYPAKGVPTFIPMVPGLVKAACRAFPGLKMTARSVYENDEFYVDWSGFEDNYVHKPNLDDPGELKQAYAIAVMPDGSKRILVISKKDWEIVRQERIAQFKGKDNVWTTWEHRMAEKMALKRLCKEIMYMMTPGSTQSAHSAFIQTIDMASDPYEAEQAQQEHEPLPLPKQQLEPEIVEAPKKKRGRPAKAVAEPKPEPEPTPEPDDEMMVPEPPAEFS